MRRPVQSSRRPSAAAVRSAAPLLPLAVAVAVGWWVVGCATPIPQAIRTGARPVSELGLQAERIASGTSRIFEIRPAEGVLMVVTYEGAVWLDTSGSPIRSIAFEPEVIQSPVASGADVGSTRPAFVGFSHESKELLLYDWDGRRQTAAPVEHEYVKGLLIADVSGGPEAEVVVLPAGAKHLEIYDGEGRLLREVWSPFYLTAIGATNADGDQNEELIASAYPNEEGKGTFYVLDGEGGRAIREWEYDSVSGFAVVGGEGRPLIVTEADGSFRVLSLEGDELGRYQVPYSEHFTDVLASPWRGGWVLVGSGSGYRPYHMIAVLNAGGRLVYQEFGEGWSRALAVPDPSGSEFFLARGSELWKYSLAE